MCRYLVSRGASTTKTSRGQSNLAPRSTTHNFWCPMNAATNAGQLDICKFLYAHGAKADICKVNRVNSYGWSPFHSTAVDQHYELLQWLVFHGALDRTDGNSDVINVRRLQVPSNGAAQDYPNICQSYEFLLEWAEDVIQNHSSLLMFLCGTLPPSDSNSGHSCILQNLSGHPGVRKHISTFVRTECVTPKHLRMLYHLTKILPWVLSDVRSIMRARKALLALA